MQMAAAGPQNKTSEQDLTKKQCIPRNGGAGIAAGPFLNEFPYPLGVLLSAADLDQGADDGAHHIP